MHSDSENRNVQNIWEFLNESSLVLLTHSEVRRRIYWNIIWTFNLKCNPKETSAFWCIYILIISFFERGWKCERSWTECLCAFSKLFCAYFYHKYQFYLIPTVHSFKKCLQEVLSASWILLPIMESEGTLPCSQGPTAGPYPEPNESS
jgi:hypothetical protein